MLLARFSMLSLALCATALAGPAEDAKTAETAGDRLAALDAWRRAIEADPTSPEAYVSLARLQIRMKDPGGAVATLEQLVERVPTYKRGRYRLAFGLRKARRYREAADHYRQYIAGAPADPDAQFGLAESLRQLGDREGALDAYRTYVKLELRPSEAKWVRRANEEIARLEASVGVQPGAERPLEPEPVAEKKKAEKKKAKKKKANLLGPLPPGVDPDAMFAKKDYKGAAGGYRHMARRRPDAAVTRYRHGLASAAAGDLKSAEHSAAHAERLDPGNPTAGDLAAIVRARRARAQTEAPSLRTVKRALQEGRVRTAEQLAARALAKAKAKERRPLLRARGEALVALGRADEALRAYKAAAALGTPGADAYLELGEVALMAGDKRGARYYLELAAATGSTEDPAAVRARERLADLPRGGAR